MAYLSHLNREVKALDIDDTLSLSGESRFAGNSLLIIRCEKAGILFLVDCGRIMFSFLHIINPISNQIILIMEDYAENHYFAGNKLKISSEKYTISTKQSHKEDELGYHNTEDNPNFYMTDIMEQFMEGKFRQYIPVTGDVGIN